jgi:hypothetical protein
MQRLEDLGSLADRRAEKRVKIKWKESQFYDRKV